MKFIGEYGPVACIGSETLLGIVMSAFKMGAIRLILPVAAMGWSLWADADARHGADFFRTQGCENCHAVKGAGAAKAPDLGRRLDRDYTPAGIAARMWSHAPVMWAGMAKENIPAPQ